MSALLASRVRRAAWAILKPSSLEVRRRTRQLQQEQWLDGEQIARLNSKRLSQLVSHAAARVPYYRDVLGDRVPREREIAQEGIQALPLLDRATLMEAFDQLRSDVPLASSSYTNSSGGSTGQPVRFIQNADFGAWTGAVKMLFDGWTGYRLGQPKVVLWGAERDLFEGRETLKRRLGRRIRNEVWLNAFRMSTADMAEYVRILQRNRPVQVLGYASSLFELADYAIRMRERLPSPIAVLSSASPLHDYMRTRIAEAFDAPIFDRYGCREFGDAACQCEHLGGLHVCLSTHHVEVIRDDGSPAPPGEIGELVVTPLWNYAMPLLRYRIGDQAVWADSRCGCGRGYPILARVVGRTVETLIRPDGGVVSPIFLIHLLGVTLERGFFKQFQCVQEEVDLIQIKAVLTPSCSSKNQALHAYMREIEQRIQVAMGTRCSIRFDFVEEIPSAPSGKYHYVISKVHRDISSSA